MGELIYMNHKKIEKILASGGDIMVMVDTHRKGVDFPHDVSPGGVKVLHLGPNLQPPARVNTSAEGFSSVISIKGQTFDVSFPWQAVLGVTATFPPGGGGSRGRKAA